MTYTQPASILGSFTSSQQAIMLEREAIIARMFGPGTQGNTGGVNSVTAMSPLYYPLPADAPVAGDSPAIISRLGTIWPSQFTGINRTGYGVPVHIVKDGAAGTSTLTSFQKTSSAPTFQPWVDQQVAAGNIRVPTGWTYPYTGTDRGAEFLRTDGAGNPISLTSVHVYNLTSPTTGTFNNMGIIRVADSMGGGSYLFEDGGYFEVHPAPGYSPSGDTRWKYAPGAAGSRIPYAPTIVRAGELALGRIDHPLMIIADPAWIKAGFSYPASWTDSSDTGTGRIMEGQYIRLPASFDIDAWAVSAGATRSSKIVARALQEFGGFVGDRSSPGAVALSGDTSTALGFDPWPTLFADSGSANPIKALPLMDCVILEANYDPSTEVGATWAPTAATITSNAPPTVSLSGPSSLASSAGGTITATANDPDGTIASYAWVTTEGVLTGSGSSVTLTNDATATTRTAIVTCTVTDNLGLTAAAALSVTLTATPSSLYGGRGVVTVDTGTMQLPAAIDVSLTSGVSTAIQSAIDAGSSTVLQIDGFAGATDDDKHVAAWAFAAAATRKPVLQYPARTFGPLSTPIAAFSGMRAIGPTGNDGPKNQEISSGNLVNHKISVACGTGTSSLFVQSASISEVIMSDISWTGTAGSQWWHNTNGATQSIYPGQFHSLSFDGFLNVLGNDTQKFTGTQFVFSGHWTVLNYSGTPLHIGGSDNTLWLGGFLNSNSPASVAGAGKPILHLDYLEKSSIGYVYITAENAWTGLRVTGPTGRAITFFGGVFEGRAASNPATYPVIDIRGCRVVMHAPDLGYVTTTNGAIEQSGGVLALLDPYYRKATAAATTFPMLYQTGGIAHVQRPMESAGNAVRIRWKDAALGSQLEDLAAPATNTRTNWGT